jgi:hypothetical protein
MLLSSVYSNILAATGRRRHAATHPHRARRAGSVSRSTLIATGDKLVILDEDGTLVLATPGDGGLVAHARASVLGARAWTAPTLSGTTLYLRDLKQIVALDLGRR